MRSISGASTLPSSAADSHRHHNSSHPPAISPTSAEDVLKVLQSNQTNYLTIGTRCSGSRSFSGVVGRLRDFDNGERSGGGDSYSETKHHPCQRKDSGIVHTMTDGRRSVLKDVAFNSLFQLSEEYNADHDRLDKVEQEESRERRRRHSLFEHFTPQQWDRRGSICTITTEHGGETLKEGTVPGEEEDDTQGQLASRRKSSSPCSASSSFSVGEMQQRPVHQIKLFLETREAQKLLAPSNEVDQLPAVEVELEDEILSPEEEEHMMRLMHLQHHQYHRRRSSLTNFNRQAPMEELAEEGEAELESSLEGVGGGGEVQLVVPPPSPNRTSLSVDAASALPNHEKSECEPHRAMLDTEEQLQSGSKGHEGKRRSKSLYPSLGNQAFSGLLRLRNAVLPHNSGASASSFGKGRAPKPPYNYPRPFANAGRSESIDSGFSCASSASSFSSGSDEGEQGKNSDIGARRGRSASVIHAGPLSLLSAELDQTSWLKSIKKLVELTKQLKSSPKFASSNSSVSTATMGEGSLGSSPTITMTTATEDTTTASESRKPSLVVENVKKFIRHNDWPVSHEIRADIWRVLCQNKDFESNKQLYTQQLEELTKSGVKTLRPAFLAMDGIVVHDHGLTESGAVALQKLLIVIECVRPEIRYVPILYPLCAMFLHYMSAEETFACMMRLLSQGSTFILQSELAHYASFHTLLSLLKKYKKGAYSLLKRRIGTSDDLKLAEVFTEWAPWIFKWMHFEHLVRVMDCFLVEGHKMLLRVVLSIVYIWCKERPRGEIVAKRGQSVLRSSTMPSSRSPTVSNAKSTLMGGKGGLSNLDDDKSVEERIVEVQGQIAEIAQNCPISVQTLLDMGCSIRNFKHTSFEHRQKHYEDKFRDEVARRRADRVHGQVRPHRSVYTAAFESKVVDTEAASELMGALPSRFQLETPQLLFRLSEHGASFVQLWSQIDEAEQSILLIRSTSGDIIGAYCSSCWAERRDVKERSKTKYFGTGESFVWNLHPELCLPVIYYWAGRMSESPDSSPQMFMTAGDKFMIIGSGGGDAIAIRDELTQGVSYPCETFASPALVEGNQFVIDELEIFNVISSRAKA